MVLVPLETWPEPFEKNVSVAILTGFRLVIVSVIDGLCQHHGTQFFNQFDTLGIPIIQPVIVTKISISEYKIRGELNAEQQLNKEQAVDPAQQAS